MTTYTTSWTAMRPSLNSLSVARSSATRPAYWKCSLFTTLVRRIVPSCWRLSAMAPRRFSMKYQLKVEQARMRMRLKNNTNFVRRLRNRFAGNGMGAMEASGWSGEFNCLSSLIDFIDETHQLLRKRNAEEPRGLEIDGDLESLDRHGIERHESFPVENAPREQSGFPADIAVADGHVEQRPQTCKLR